MTARTVLLVLHLTAVAGWLGADILQYVAGPRISRASAEADLAWARLEVFLHDTYYAIIGVLVLVTGVLLVLDGNWSWSSGFIWVGAGAVVLGAVLGGGGLGGRAKRRLAALDAGDTGLAEAIARRTLPLAVVVTALPIIAMVAMVEKAWA